MLLRCNFLVPGVVAIPVTMINTNFNFFETFKVGNPLPLSYIPDFNLGYTSRMTFWQRLENTIYGLADEINHRFFYIPMQDKIMRKFFGDDLPPLDEMVKNTSLVLVNHHYSLGYPRPNLPNMVEVGGFHINPVKRLPDVSNDHNFILY